jgi:hypothetical protein
VVIGAKGGENIFHKDRTLTKIELKGGEAQRGRKMLFTKIYSKIGELIKEGDQLKF